MNGIMVALGLMASATYPITTTLPEANTPVEKMIQDISEKNGVDPAIIANVIMCESSMNPTAVGDNGTSFGLAQINLPAHPEITKEQAFNPIFAIEFMASEMAKGRSWKWTCWKKIYQTFELSPTILLNESEVLYYENIKGRDLVRA